MKLSIIIPFYNEEKNIPLLLDELQKELKKIGKEYEIILVDDGSTPLRPSDSEGFARQAKTKNIRLFTHRKRMGKGEALATGIKNATGDYIVFMDGDLQDDPADVHKFLQKIEQGADLVNGIRSKRNDNLLIKLYSFFANVVLHLFFHSPFTDINCGFKMFKKELLDEYPLYGNNFRFFPLSVYYRGYVVEEVAVHNRKRVYGVSKFGSMKLFAGILDMITAYFVFLFAEQPLHFFGMIGGVLFVIGLGISIYLAIERIFFNVLLYRRPLLQLGVVLIIVGIQIVVTGLIGELIVYLNKQTKK